MSFNISQIKSTLAKGGARPTLFKLSSIRQSASTADAVAGDMTYHVRATTLPGSNLGVLTTNWRGRAVKFPGVRTYDPWTVTILNDDGEYRTELFDWMQQMAGKNDGQRDATHGAFNDEDHYKDFSVYQLSKAGDVTRQYKMVNAFPVAMGDIGLDWATEGFQEYTVTWRYDYFEAYSWSGSGSSARAGNSEQLQPSPG